MQRFPRNAPGLNLVVVTRWLQSPPVIDPLIAGQMRSVIDRQITPTDRYGGAGPR